MHAALRIGDRDQVVAVVVGIDDGEAQAIGDLGQAPEPVVFVEGGVPRRIGRRVDLPARVVAVAVHEALVAVDVGVEHHARALVVAQLVLEGGVDDARGAEGCGLAAARIGVFEDGGVAGRVAVPPQAPQRVVLEALRAGIAVHRFEHLAFRVVGLGLGLVQRIDAAHQAVERVVLEARDSAARVGVAHRVAHAVVGVAGRCGRADRSRR